MKCLLSSAVVVLTLGSSYIARADDVTLVAPGGMRCPIDRMTPDFERKTGHKLKATIGAGGATHQQVVRGEPFDVPIVQPPYPEVLASGHVVVSSETPLATVAVAVAVRKGDRKPDISTPEAVKRMLLAAKAISYPDPAGGAAAGVSFDKTLEKLGIAQQLKPKIKLAQGGAAAMAKWTIPASMPSARCRARFRRPPDSSASCRRTRRRQRPPGRCYGTCRHPRLPLCTRHQECNRGAELPSL